MDYLIRQKNVFTKEENIKISNTVVLIAGCGGLGTNQAQILQRIGVKKIYLVDYDKIEVSNLNRQVLYSYDDINEYKVMVAKKKLNQNNLSTEIVAVKQKIDENFEMPLDVDLVLDALDNYESRIIIEKKVLEKNLPFIHGGINSMYGQITTITTKSRIRIKDLISKTDDTNISSYLPVITIVASLQVEEGIKVVLSKNNSLLNKILFVDLDIYSFTLVDY